MKSQEILEKGGRLVRQIRDRAFESRYPLDKMDEKGVAGIINSQIIGFELKTPPNPFSAADVLRNMGYPDSGEATCRQRYPREIEAVDAALRGLVSTDILGIKSRTPDINGETSEYEVLDKDRVRKIASAPAARLAK